MRIDVHSHLMLPALEGKAGPYGPSCTVDDNGRIESRLGDVVSWQTSIDLQDKIARDPTRAREHAEEWLRQLSDPAVPLQEMDDKAIDMMGVTIPPLHYLYWADPSVGVPFARAQNEALAEYCQHDPS